MPISTTHQITTAMAGLASLLFFLACAPTRLSRGLAPYPDIPVLTGNSELDVLRIDASRQRVG